MSFSVVGKSLPRVDSIEKATGQAKYLDDLFLPGMLHGKILRSPLPHARIVHIDTQKAERLIGVKGIITAKDTLRVPFSFQPWLRDKCALEFEKVRYIGDEIAAVAAVDRDAAEEALDLIEIELEELPAIFNPVEAMAPGAPEIHRSVRSNIATKIEWEYGNIQRGFDESDYILEDRFTTSRPTHCSLEPHGALASVDNAGKLTIWMTTQNPHTVKDDLALMLGIPLHKIRVIKPTMGGAFGSRTAMDPLDVICARLAQKCRKPVKIINSREEEFYASRCRHPMIIDIKTGVKKDGKLLAREVTVIADNGAYNSHGPRVIGYAGKMLFSLYHIPHTRYTGLAVYTNNPYGGGMRGFGNPQVTFASESQLDMISERLGIDPVELRLRNLVKSGDVTSTGAEITSCGIQECLSRAVEISGWKAKSIHRGKNRGFGVSCMIHGSGAKGFFGDSNVSDSFVKMDPDGSVIVYSGAADLGQGSDTVLTQIVAEELGVKFEQVRIVSADTEITPIDYGSYGTRTTFAAGNAVRMAASAVRQQLFDVAAEMLGVLPSALLAKEGTVYTEKTPSSEVSINKVARIACYSKGRPLAGRGFYNGPDSPSPDISTYFGNTSPAYCFAAQVAEVEVDPETGQVKILNLVAAHDLGKAINPMAAEGQIEGGIVQGIGFALMEDLVCSKGETLNPNFSDYKVLKAPDVPPIKTILVESNDPNGPFGAKGVAEPALVPTTPAIANAIYDAIGVRMKDLPISPEKILESLKKRNLAKCVAQNEKV
jgi:4-hydroxybenzoyl-CoA reductase alpha subunit